MKLIAAAACLAAALAIAGCGGSSGEQVTFSTTSSTASTASSPSTTSTTQVPIDSLIGPEGITYEANPALAPPDSQLTGLPVDGIQCQTLRQLAYQVHTHVQVYVHGQARALPGGIGLVQPNLQETAAGPEFSATTCYYWVHTLTQDGVISADSPVSRRFTLGQVFQIWDQPLSSDQVATAHGHVTAYVDGRLWKQSPQRIPLVEHESVELAVGSPVPPFEPVDWSSSEL